MAIRSDFFPGKTGGPGPAAHEPGRDGSQSYAASLIERLGPAAARRIQRRAKARAAGPESPGPAAGEARMHRAADLGTRGASGPLPHLDAIQSSFGAHDVSGIKAHTDDAARAGAS